jgi:hypothetical protein
MSQNPVSELLSDDCVIIPDDDGHAAGVVDIDAIRNTDGVRTAGGDTRTRRRTAAPPVSVPRRAKHAAPRTARHWFTLLRVALAEHTTLQSRDGQAPADRAVVPLSPEELHTAYDVVAIGLVRHIREKWPSCTVVFLDVTGNEPGGDFSVGMFMLALYDTNRPVNVYGIGAARMAQYHAAARHFASRIRLFEYTLTAAVVAENTARMWNPRVVVSTSPDLPVAHVAAWAHAAKTCGYFRHRLPRDGRIDVLPHVSAAAPISPDEVFLDVECRYLTDAVQLKPYRADDIAKKFAP